VTISKTGASDKLAAFLKDGPLGPSLSGIEFEALAPEASYDKDSVRAPLLEHLRRLVENFRAQGLGP
jgi:hypothetical protein